MSGSVSGAFRKQMSRDLVHRVKAGSWKSVLYASFIKDLICLKDERTPGSCVLGKLMEAPALVRHRIWERSCRERMRTACWRGCSIVLAMPFGQQRSSSRIAGALKDDASSSFPTVAGTLRPRLSMKIPGALPPDFFCSSLGRREAIDRGRLQASLVAIPVS